MIVGVCGSLFVRGLQVVERARVDLVSSSDLLCFEFHLNSVFAFNESFKGRGKCGRDEDARIQQLCCSEWP